jgi:hypothetical protein
MTNPPFNPNIAGKPKGRKQKPALLFSNCAGLRQLAMLVQIDDAEPLQKAAKYILKLVDYVESDAYIERRNLAQQRVEKFRNKHGN